MLTRLMRIFALIGILTVVFWVISIAMYKFGDMTIYQARYQIAHWLNQDLILDAFSGILGILLLLCVIADVPKPCPADNS